jgi:hypothetical protein
MAWCNPAAQVVADATKALQLHRDHMKVRVRGWGLGLRV